MALQFISSEVNPHLGANRVPCAEPVSNSPVVYSGDPLLPHPALARWLEQRVAEGASLDAVAAGGD